MRTRVCTPDLVGHREPQLPAHHRDNPTVVAVAITVAGTGLAAPAGMQARQAAPATCVDSAGERRHAQVRRDEKAWVTAPALGNKRESKIETEGFDFHRFQYSGPI